MSAQRKEPMKSLQDQRMEALPSTSKRIEMRQSWRRQNRSLERMPVGHVKYMSL